MAEVDGFSRELSKKLEDFGPHEDWCSIRLLTELASKNINLKTMGEHKIWSRHLETQMISICVRLENDELLQNYLEHMREKLSLPALQLMEYFYTLFCSDDKPWITSDESMRKFFPSLMKVFLIFYLQQKKEEEQEEAEQRESPEE